MTAIHLGVRIVLRKNLKYDSFRRKRTEKSIRRQAGTSQFRHLINRRRASSPSSINIEDMDASDLAREVCSCNRLPDRPSPLTLTLVGSPFPHSFVCHNKVLLQITAPVANGRQVFRLQIDHVVLDYDSSNIEGVAVYVEALTTDEESTIVLFSQGEKVVEWRIRGLIQGRRSFPENNKCLEEQRALRLQTIHQILKSLITL